MAGRAAVKVSRGPWLSSYSRSSALGLRPLSTPASPSTLSAVARKAEHTGTGVAAAKSPTRHAAMSRP